MAGDLASLALYLALVGAAAWGFGAYMAWLFGERPAGVVLRAAGVDPAAEQGWAAYAGAAIAFNAAGAVLLFAILATQAWHPWNPEGMAGLSAPLAFNTAISFVTNTNWQAYGGETTMSYFSQMAGLTVQNFVSAATGVAVALAVIRGFVRREASTLGNFWLDLTRAVFGLFLPLAVVMGLALVFLGVPQNLSPYVEATTLEGASQTIAQGPAASQIAIKQLGTNGGGFFSVNSAHPLENPTHWTNLLQSWAILAIPAAFCFLYGRWAGDARQGHAILAAMAVMFLAGLGALWAAELAGNPLIAEAVAAGAANMEGKEVRFGVFDSALWAAATTAASNGSVNAMHDSLTPLGGLVAMLNIMLGEIVFGGVGAGFYGMLVFVVLTVFVAGLMVGRTPEVLGKKVEAREVTLAVVAFLSMPLGILVAGGVAAVGPVTGTQDAGPHGLSEILYAYASATGNNGSAFGGFGAGETWHLTAQGLCMILGRYAFIVPMLAIAGALATKRVQAASAGTFPTHGPLFVTLLIAVILILGGLTFFPALALGPLAEHFAMTAGTTY
ncbi:MAG: potassium-transporting ATPase subunit KdpA [Paracoccaceae bacterium]